jgi:hypothetical protein
MSLLEEELRQIESELTLVKQTIQEVFAFHKNVDLRILGKDHFLLCNVEKLFFDIFDRYVSDHLIPATLEQLQDPRLTAEARLHRFQAVLKNLYGFYLNLDSFWKAVEKSPLSLERIREKIKGCIAYKVLPAINASAYFQLFLEQYFAAYQETLRQNIQKAQTNEGLQQLVPKVLLIQNMIPLATTVQSAEHPNIGFLHQFIQLIYSSDELFQDELYKMLANKCETFVNNLPKPGDSSESRQSLIYTFYNIYIRRFFEHIVHEIANDLKPLRSTQGQLIVVGPDVAHQRQVSQSSQMSMAQGHNFIREPLGNPNHFKKSSIQAQRDFITTPEQTKGDHALSKRNYANVNDQQDKGRTQGYPGQFQARDEASTQHNNTDSLPLEKFHIKFRMEDLTKSLKILLQRLFIKFIEKYLSHIIESFDHNIAIIADLKKALNEVGNFEEFAVALETNVIHPLISISKSTDTLLAFYINLLKFWSSLDHDFQILQKSTYALKRYLISREDALRCIIDKWVRELKGKDKNSPSLIHHPIAVPIGDDKEDATDPENSEDSDVDFHIVNSKKESSKLKYKKCDVKTLLVDLYGSKEKFLKEYENYLAEKLLMFEEINPREEGENIQLLKKNLKLNNTVTKWDVLVLDMQTSESITNEFHTTALDAQNCHFLITSKTFWPINYDADSFSVDKLPIAKIQKDFRDLYTVKNKPRTVTFHNNLGKVELDFKINDKVITAKCQPVHAALISLFSEPAYFDSGVRLSDIVKLLDCTPEYVQQKMHFWINHNIVKERNISAGQFNARSLTNIGEAGLRNQSDDAPENDDLVYSINKEYIGPDVQLVDKDDENEMIIKGFDQAKGDEQSLQTKAKIEQLIKTILQGSGAKTQSKIYELLQKLYASDMPPTLTSVIFGKILSKMVRKNMIHQQGEIFYVS